eukprot:295764-Rhodomonas_salina.2
MPCISCASTGHHIGNTRVTSFLCDARLCCDQSKGGGGGTKEESGDLPAYAPAMPGGMLGTNIAHEGATLLVYSPPGHDISDIAISRKGSARYRDLYMPLLSDA